MDPQASLSPDQGWGSALVTAIGIEPWRIPVVALSAVCVYLVFLMLVKLFGTRILAAWSSFDTVVVVMCGAVAGRVIIGHPPTVAAGLIGLVTLMAMEALLGAGRRLRALRGSLPAHAVVLVAHGRLISSAIRRQHLHDRDLYSAVRRAGISRLEEVQCVILEPTGALSVISEAADIDPELLEGVSGAHLVLGSDGKE
ncbi:DUF421 domain-containing protein [Corynebacterium glyciniphilum]|uniref:DUF421 domain-containing protein n=1 Tax=Corynebacterium glyciniphilum TaxID=1404244 RepID=UPI00265414E4|nr:YetF domain-containing protein [Corynebacterium glyciniphilum]MDN5684674.1 DUF421 domain-containing protein [Corynebacterium glyciniphilum]MDN6706974.1 DUF421 domain-containing protein [Corynebacterium glyciniphilum]